MTKPTTERLSSLFTSLGKKNEPVLFQPGELVAVRIGSHTDKLCVIDSLLREEFARLVQHDTGEKLPDNCIYKPDALRRPTDEEIRSLGAEPLPAPSPAK